MLDGATGAGCARAVREQRCGRADAVRNGRDRASRPRRGCGRWCDRGVPGLVVGSCGGTGVSGGRPEVCGDDCGPVGAIPGSVGVA